MVADGFHLRHNIVVVGDGFLTLVLNTVGILAGVDHILDILADFGDMF